MSEPIPSPAAHEAEPPPDEQLSLFAEFALFLRENKKWWLVPMIAMVGVLMLLILAGNSPVAPFIYTLF